MDWCALFRNGLSSFQVKGVMIDNIDKVTQRGDKLEDINERAGTNASVSTHM